MAVEEIAVSYTKSRANIYRVPQKQWRKWSDVAHQVFNEVFSSMVKNQPLFIHPQQTASSRAHWRTTAWNAAWTAASAVNNAIT